MISKSGIKVIYLTERGKLFTAPVYELRAGLRDKAELIINDSFNAAKTVRGVHLPTMIDFKLSSKTFQAGFDNLKSMLYYVSAGGCEGQIIAHPQSSDPKSGGVFNFAGDNFLGSNFKFMLSNKERSLAFDLEMATDIDEGKDIISQSLTNAILEEAVSGIDKTKFIAPQFSALTFNSSNVFAKDELLEWSIAIDTKETEKTVYNRSKVDYVKLSITAKGSDATITNIVSKLNNNSLSQLVFTSKVSSSINDVITINPNAIAQQEDITIGDDSRNMAVKWEAEIPLGLISIDGTNHNLTINAE